jgi:lysozyme family protein
MDFKKCVGIVIEREGGDKVVNDPDDPGGLTRFGISKASYPELDIANLTREDAERIYRRDYWDKLRCDELPETIRLFLFDSAVNQGCFGAVKTLQRSLGVQADGVIGPQTLGAMKRMDAKELVSSFMTERALAYSRMKGFDKYGKGWYRRLFSITLEK